MGIITKLLTVCPRPVLRVLCEIVDIDEDTALNVLTPRELLDILAAFWELNDLSGFFGDARRLGKSLARTATAGTSSG